MKRLIATSLLVLATARPAHADVAAAARAFSDGQAAQLEGNYERAAQSYELAFNISPSREALRSAVRARQLSNQLARAATLAQVLQTQYADDPASTKLAGDVIAEARTKLARITVTCAPRCTLAVGGRAISLTAAPSQVVFATPGHQVLEITLDGDRSVTREVTVKAGDDLVLPIAAPAPVVPPAPPAPASAPSVQAPPPAAHAPRGLPRGYAIGGAAVTLALGAITIWSALDTTHAHDAYVKAPTAKGWSDGRSKQLRTNVLLGATAGVGVGTALVALFWTRWSGGAAGSPEVAIDARNGGLTLSLGRNF